MQNERMDMDLDGLRSRGVVGAGGAGFPTHLKLKRRVDTVIMNAAECEPLLHKDKELLRAFPHRIIDALRLVMDTVGAARGIVGVKKKYTDVIELIGPLLGPSIDLQLLEDFYPAGDEIVLTNECTRRIVPAGGLPPDVGVLVQNVETLLNVDASEPVTTSYLTVAGDVPRACTIGVPVGTLVGDLLDVLYGFDPRGHAIIAGGAMMGRVLDDLETPVLKTTGGLIVLPDEHPLVGKYRRSMGQQRWIGSSTCDQCALCTDLCPRFLLGHPIQPHLAMRSLQMAHRVDDLNQGSFFCCECNLCSFFSCPIDLDPKAICTEYKRTHRRNGSPLPGHPFGGPHPAIDGRRVSISQLMERLGLMKWNRPAPLVRDEISISRVRLPLVGPFGVVAHPIVNKGQQVIRGQMVAEVDRQEPGVPLHASIDGTITDITVREIAITGQTLTK